MKLDLELIRDTALLHLQQTFTSSIFIISFIFSTSDFYQNFFNKEMEIFFIRHPVQILSGGAGGGSGNDNGDIF